jgi:hypothetical protein
VSVQWSQVTCHCTRPSIGRFQCTYPMNKKRTPCKFSIYVYYPSIILARISTFRYLLICSPDSKYLGIVIIPQLIEVACGTVLSSHCSNKVANEYSLSLSLSLSLRPYRLSLSLCVRTGRSCVGRHHQHQQLRRQMSD